MDKFEQCWTKDKEKPRKSTWIQGVNEHQRAMLDNTLVPGTRIELVQPKAEGF
jgi:hypothetical protein